MRRTIGSASKESKFAIPSAGKTRIPRKSSISRLSGFNVPSTSSNRYVPRTTSSAFERRGSDIGRLSTERRFSSIGGSRVQQDSRSCGDRSTQILFFSKLSNFLRDNKYPGSFDETSLRKMTQRDFRDIFFFLYRLIEPNFKPTAKFEETVIMVLQRLEYPFPIAKSVIQAVTSRLTTVVSLLSYLLDAAVYSSQNDSLNICAVPCGEFEDSQALVDITRKILKMTKDKKEFTMEQQERFIDELCDNIFGTSERNDMLDKKYLDLKNRLAEVERQIAEQSRLAESLDSKRKEEESIRNYIQSMRQHHQAKASALVVLQRQKELVDKQLEQVREETAEVNGILERQEYTPAEIEAARHQIEKFNLCTREENHQTNLCLAKVENFEMEKVRCTTQLKQLSDACNGLCGKLATWDGSIPTALAPDIEQMLRELPRELCTRAMITDSLSVTKANIAALVARRQQAQNAVALSMTNYRGEIVAKIEEVKNGGESAKRDLQFELAKIGHDVETAKRTLNQLTTQFEDKRMELLELKKEEGRLEQYAMRKPEDIETRRKQLLEEIETIQPAIKQLEMEQRLARDIFAKCEVQLEAEMEKNEGYIAQHLLRAKRTLQLCGSETLKMINDENKPPSEQQ